ncbi:SCP-2 sterol transfer family protein [Acinetobacter qingfengensis]|uniref:SCP-2 sterol transfer family protein n=1 Tax=Acinetobacter qingfengensis TaxID=1262585 RepID=A0A1E7R4Z4_9GAMM|nr:SCP-2 sterol transfer family protein [Acinetobacter qingfengensis]KAA8732393.1 SCP-2 sterol transfer family protein [Acinetobacter qingfengensis]OEY94388.1 SCP-2 sterol transfer family protein [Acinetobacter qingfengensis]
MKLSILPVIKLPVVDVTTDPLDLLLAGLTLRMKQLARTSPKFIELIYDRKFRIEIAAENGVARHLVIDHGQVSNEPAKGQAADFSIHFVDSDYAVKTILKGNPSAFMSGMQSGDIKMEGDFTLLVWFNKAAKLIVPKLPKPLTQKYQQVRQLIKQKTGK